MEKKQHNALCPKNEILVDSDEPFVDMHLICTFHAFDRITIHRIETAGIRHYTCYKEATYIYREKDK